MVASLVILGLLSTIIFTTVDVLTVLSMDVFSAHLITIASTVKLDTIKLVSVDVFYAI
jgi:hypothetical protein